MTRPTVSVIVRVEGDTPRLDLTVRSAMAAATAAGVATEIVLALADAGSSTGEASTTAATLGARTTLASAETTRSAAEIAWGETVVLCRGGDLVSISYVAGAMACLSGNGEERRIARPAACVGYGAAPYVREQTDLSPDPAGRALSIHHLPFQPPLVAARSLLLDLPDRSWGLEQDWAWTIETLSYGVAHRVAPGAVYVEWTGERALPAMLPAAQPIDRPASNDAEHRNRQALSELRAALIEAEARTEEARRHIALMQKSTSWRVTGPLRVLSSILSGRR